MAHSVAWKWLIGSWEWVVYGRAVGRFRFLFMLMLVCQGLLGSGCQPGNSASSESSEEEFQRIKAEAKKEAAERLAKLGLSRTNVLEDFVEDVVKNPDGSDQFKAPRPLTREEKQVRQKRVVEWCESVLGGAYEKVGQRDPAWDSAVLEMFRGVVSEVAGVEKPALNQRREEIRRQGQKARDQGCKDPLVHFVWIRFVEDLDAGLSPQETVDRLLEMKRNLEATDYSPYWKSLMNAKVARTIAQYLREGKRVRLNRDADVGHLLIQAGQHLGTALADGAMPGEVVFEACKILWNSVPDFVAVHGHVYGSFRESLMKSYSKSGVAQWVKGEFYVDYAWVARTGDWAENVSPERFEVFARRLQVASEALNEAWDRDPSNAEVALSMMTVELGQGVGRARMERWFGYAMALDPNFFKAGYSKMTYLEPKWHGDAKAVLQFGRECLESKVWGGEVPYLMVSAHERLARNAERSGVKGYWLKEGVWGDVEAAFLKLFSSNPPYMTDGYHQNYALMAYRCEKWDIMERELKLMPRTNWNYFGGAEVFREMVNTLEKKKKGQN